MKNMKNGTDKLPPNLLVLLQFYEAGNLVNFSEVCQLAVLSWHNMDSWHYLSTDQHAHFKCWSKYLHI